MIAHSPIEIANSMLLATTAPTTSSSFGKIASHVRRLMTASTVIADPVLLEK